MAALNFQPKKILVIRLSSLGDVILATALLRQVRRLYPAAQISFAVKKQFAPLLENHPCVDQVLPFDSRGTHNGIHGLYAYCQQVRELGFDLVLDLHGNLRSHLISRASSGIRLRAKKYLWQRRRMVWFKEKFGKVPHAAQRYLDCLKPLQPEGFPNASLKPEIRLNRGAEAWARAFLKKKGVNASDKLIAVAPGAAWATKRWNSRGYAETIKGLAKSPRTKFLMLGEGKDVFVCEDICSLLGKLAERCLNLAGETNLDQLAALISRCRLMLCNDSGPMHLAVALGVPVAAFFGPTVKDFGFSPLGEKDLIFEKDLACRPCSLHGGERCPIGTHECLDSLNPVEVLEGAKKLINSR